MKKWCRLGLALLASIALMFSLAVTVWAQASPLVERSVSKDNPQPGETITVKLKPSGFTSFYGVEEEAGELIYTGVHTADGNPTATTFVMLQEQGFTYDLKVPDTAKEGATFTISGEFWTDPANRIPIPATTITVAQSQTSVVRTVSNSNPAPGEEVEVRLEPSGFTGFYAVQEASQLTYTGEHSADSNPEGTTFTMLTEKGFSYVVKVPTSAQPGSTLTITGQFWQDPANIKDILPTELTVSTPTSPQNGGLSCQQTPEGEASGLREPALVFGVVLTSLGLIRFGRRRKV